MINKNIIQYGITSIGRALAEMRNDISLIEPHLEYIKKYSSLCEFIEINRICYELQRLMVFINNNNLYESYIGIINEILDDFEDIMNVSRNASSNINNIDYINKINIDFLLEKINNIILSGTKNTGQIDYDSSNDQLEIDLTESFILEVEENYSYVCDELLVSLSNNPNNNELICELFRVIHSLKGNIGLLISSFSKESHNVNNAQVVLEVFQNIETLLEEVRADKLKLLPNIIDIFFKTMDLLPELVTVIKEDQGQIINKNILDEIKDARENIIKNNGNIENSTNVVSKTIDISSKTIRVSEDKLTKLINLSGELATIKNTIVQLVRKINTEYNLPSLSKEIKETGIQIDRIYKDMEQTTLSARMVEVKHVFQKFPRVIRDYSMQSGKRIFLVMEGENTELDKTIIEKIGDPLMHMVRNSLDHGIEMPEERESAGKSPEGKIILRAFNRGRSIIIEIEDDGRGIDVEKVRRKAIDKGFITSIQAAGMTKKQLTNLIFAPGFSTAEKTTDVSGRGVGMDVVRNNISALKGSVNVFSQLMKGTKITVQLPLTLAITKGLLTRIDNQIFVFPIDNLVESLKVNCNDLMSARGERILVNRGELIGIISLAEVFGLPYSEKTELSTVIITDGENKMGVEVDQIINDQEILVKPLPENLTGDQIISGATILGDGTIALVVNCLELISKGN